MLIINQLFGYSKKFATFANGNKTTQIYNAIPNKPNSNGKITIKSHTLLWTTMPK